MHYDPVTCSKVEPPMCINLSWDNLGLRRISQTIFKGRQKGQRPPQVKQNFTGKHDLVMIFKGPNLKMVHIGGSTIHPIVIRYLNLVFY